jgi:hypothetical protein
MNTTDITTLELHDSKTSLALARIIDTRMEYLASVHTTAADLEFLTLQQLAVPLLPYILQVQQERENGWLL